MAFLLAVLLLAIALGTIAVVTLAAAGVPLPWDNPAGSPTSEVDSAIVQA